MPIKTLFINQFQKGSQENANLGFGTMLGIETYSKKGVAQLTKKSTKVSGTTVTDLPIYFANATQDIIYSQGLTGKVVVSLELQATILAGINMILRIVTKQPISWS